MVNLVALILSAMVWFCMVQCGVLFDVIWYGIMVGKVYCKCGKGDRYGTCMVQ